MQSIPHSDTGTRHADIAVIGGGVVGMSCAWELARQSDARVVVFDKMVPPSGTSGGSGGVICLHDIGEIYVALSLKGYARVREFAQEHHFGFRPYGLVDVRYEPDEFPPRPGPYDRRFGGRPDSMYHYEVIDRREVLGRYPWLKPDGLKGAAFFPNLGFVVPHELVSLYQRLAESTGRVEIHPNTPVLEIRTQADRVALVVTKHGAWNVGQVVNAAGPWGAKIATLAGTSVNLTTQRIQVAFATTFDDDIGLPPLMGVAGQVDGEGVWCRGEVGGGMLFAVHRSIPRPDWVVDPDHVKRDNDPGFAQKVERSFRRFFNLPRTRFLNGWVCVYGSTEDGYPIIGRDARIRNLCHALGMNGHGMTCHAGTAQMVAEVVLRDRTLLDVTDVLGKPAVLDFSGLDNGRFDRGEPFTFALKDELIRPRDG